MGVKFCFLHADIFIYTACKDSKKQKPPLGHVCDLSLGFFALTSGLLEPFCNAHPPLFFFVGNV